MTIGASTYYSLYGANHVDNIHFQYRTNAGLELGRPLRSADVYASSFVYAVRRRRPAWKNPTTPYCYAMPYPQYIM